MSSHITSHVAELEYSAYQERQYQEITRAALHQRTKSMHYGKKFQFQAGKWNALPYKGYAVVSMLASNPGNESLVPFLTTLQDRLIAQTGMREKLYALPPESFHQTLANTLSHDRFRFHVEDKGLAEQYPEIIREAIMTIPSAPYDAPIRMQLVGLGIFGSALGILGVFNQESDYHRVLHFRQALYQNPRLNQLDVKRTRPFVGHLTLVYFGEHILPEEGKKLAEACAAINAEIARESWVFQIHQTQLRYYEDLSHFQGNSTFPTYSFCKDEIL